VLGSLFRDFSQGGVSLKDLRSVKPSGPLELLDGQGGVDLAAKTWQCVLKRPDDQLKIDPCGSRSPPTVAQSLRETSRSHGPARVWRQASDSRTRT